MSNFRLPPDTIPPHHLDPIEKNPAPPGHPAYEAWEAATRQAELELFDYQSQMLQIQPQRLTGHEFGQFYIKLAFQTLQIWAKRTLSIVITWADVRAYEKWLESYRKNYLRDAQRYLTQKIQEGPDLVETFMVELSVQLLRAERHWTANAIAKVSDNQKRLSDSAPVVKLPEPKNFPKSVRSPIAARRVEEYLNSNPTIKLTDFANKVGITDRALRSFRKTGKIRRDLFPKIAEAMNITLKELLKPE